jgi:hypothetical protein
VNVRYFVTYEKYAIVEARSPNEARQKATSWWRRRKRQPKDVLVVREPGQPLPWAEHVEEREM